MKTADPRGSAVAGVSRTAAGHRVRPPERSPEFPDGATDRGAADGANDAGADRPAEGATVGATDGLDQERVGAVGAGATLARGNGSGRDGKADAPEARDAGA